MPPKPNAVLTSATGEDQVGNGALFDPEIDSGRANGEIGGELLNGPKLHDRLPGLSFSLLLPVGGCFEEQLLTRRAIEPRLTEERILNVVEGLSNGHIAARTEDEAIH